MTPPEAIAATPGAIGRLKLYYERNEQKIAILSFICGFFFDILSVDRVDSWLAIGQQVLYLAVILAALTQMFLEEGKPSPEPGSMFVLRRWYHQYRTALVHFFLGTLLNVYTIFFFKSSSLLVSFSFLAFLVFLLWANESARVKSLGLPFKFTLLSLCVMCFSANIVPMFVGSIGLVVFLISMLAGCLPLLGVTWWIRRRSPDLFPRARRQVLVPLGGVLIGFLVFYFFRLIPPVPLSIPFIGVYHAVEKTQDTYRLSHERPAWRFWQHGDQEFLAQPGDKVYVFFRIFSPTRFSDQVQMRWYWKDDTRGWISQDAIPIKIVGGRAEGFRGYGFKSNYQPGEWKVQVETTDGREIGRVYFNLETRPEWPRSFEIDVQ
ncbi:MAG TPA: DUF2914 domain-containing protein [Burkholderiales bacterium]